MSWVSRNSLEVYEVIEYKSNHRNDLDYLMENKVMAIFEFCNNRVKYLFPPFLFPLKIRRLVVVKSTKT